MPWYKDLESEDYEVRILYLRASDVGAPHIRTRCFVVANSMRERLQTGESIAGRPFKKITRTAGFCVNASNSYNLTGLQTNSGTYENREEYRSTSRQVIARQSWGIDALPDWKNNPSEICRMDDGVSLGMDKPRLQALGNAVVPRCAYPIFEAIARIEGGKTKNP